MGTLNSDTPSAMIARLEYGRRTEQAKVNLDPLVGPQVAPRVGPRVAPRVRARELPREHPRGLISLFSALQGLPTKHPTKVFTDQGRLYSAKGRVSAFYTPSKRLL